MWLRHRGPDWSGVYCSGKNILAHERLAIVDVESGDQPLFNSTRSLALAVNGEIYNHKALQQTLTSPSPFLTHSDCEIIIHLYEQLGSGHEALCLLLNSLNGIFAFILLDDSTGDYVIARDHMGIVPLYTGRDAEGSLWVASELKALSDICVTFEDFPPGHYMSRSGELRQWYTPAWHDESFISSAPLDLLRLRTELEEAVRRQLMSDVPYGVLLSGGLDSSLIAAIAAGICANRVEDEGKTGAWWPRLHSFSVGLHDSPDLKMARVVAKQIGTVHHEFVFTVQEGLDAISSVIYHLETYDVTTIRAATPMFLMSRKIKCLGVKMVLSGEGSDEIFGGYLYFHKCPDREEMQRETVRKLKSLYKFDCVAAGTPVALADGRSVPVETVRAGDKVLALSRAGGAVPRAVQAVMDKGVADCVELLLIDGRRLVLTSDHLVRTPTGWRAAGALEVGVDRLLCGASGTLSRDPVASGRDGGAWRLPVSGSFGYDLDLVTRREEALAFARICGYILTDGCVATDGQGFRAAVFLGHALDVKAFQSDVLLLAGCVCKVDRRKRTFDLWLPKPVVNALLAVGLQPGRRVECLTHFPAYVLHADCPVEVVREFLGGLMGGDGRTVALGCSGQSQSPQLQSLAYITSRKGTVAHAQSVALEAELLTLLQRCGVTTAGTTVFVNTGVTGVSEAGRQEVKRRKKLGLQLSQKVDVSGPLLDDESYHILIDFPAAMTLPFADKVGFRFCCHKVMRLTAAAGYYRAAQLIRSQRAELAAIAKEAHVHRVVSAADALLLAKQLLGKAQLLHPAVMEWEAKQVAHLDRRGPNSRSCFTVSVALESFGLRGVFSDFRTAERYSAAAREQKIEELLARVSGDAAEDSSSSSADSDADEEVAGKVRYGVQAGAQELPLFGVLVVGRRPVGSRRVFDLAVPAPTADGDVHSFLANGVVVHNCLRANKATAAWGVEARVPFLDRQFLDFAMTGIDAKDKLCGRSGDGRIEKHILRKAFEGLLPPAILWRQKEQMSDGVGYGWIDSIKQRAEAAVSDADYASRQFRFPINTPATKEAFYIRSIFDSHFPHQSAALCVPGGPSVACSTSAAILWDASFQQMADCSGRSVAGVHENAYDDNRRREEGSRGGAVDVTQLHKINAAAEKDARPAVKNGSS